MTKQRGQRLTLKRGREGLIRERMTAYSETNSYFTILDYRKVYVCEARYLNSLRHSSLKKLSKTGM